MSTVTVRGRRAARNRPRGRPLKGTRATLAIWSATAVLVIPSAALAAPPGSESPARSVLDGRPVPDRAIEAADAAGAAVAESPAGLERGPDAPGRSAPGGDTRSGPSRSSEPATSDPGTSVSDPGIAPEEETDEAAPEASGIPVVRVVRASFEAPARHPQSLGRPDGEGSGERPTLSGTAGPLLPPLLRYLDLAWAELGRHLWEAMGDALAALWVPLLVPLAAVLALLRLRPRQANLRF